VRDGAAKHRSDANQMKMRHMQTSHHSGATQSRGTQKREMDHKDGHTEKRKVEGHALAEVAANLIQRLVERPLPHDPAKQKEDATNDR
jgi:hypothetical protein